MVAELLDPAVMAACPKKDDAAITIDTRRNIHHLIVVATRLGVMDLVERSGLDKQKSNQIKNWTDACVRVFLI